MKLVVHLQPVPERKSGVKPPHSKSFLFRLTVGAHALPCHFRHDNQGRFEAGNPLLCTFVQGILVFPETMRSSRRRHRFNESA